jgi:hypothetical protein
MQSTGESMSAKIAVGRYMLRGVFATPSPHVLPKGNSMNKLLPALMLCAFALVQVPAHAQAAKTAAPAASAAKADEKQAAKPAEKADEKKPAKKEKKGGC